MKTILAAAVAALLVGCATNAKFQTKMEGFVGQPEAVVVGTYGPPQSSYQLTDGSKVLQYTRRSQMVMPGATTTTPVTTTTNGNVTLNQGLRQTTGTYSQTSTTNVEQQAAPTVVHLGCTVNFTIDKAGVVRAWSAQGNRCVAD